jgi:hypothetical protein
MKKLTAIGRFLCVMGWRSPHKRVFGSWYGRNEMKQRRQRNARFLVVAVLLAGGCFLFPQESKAQQQPSATCEDWTAVQSWSGTITVSGSGQHSENGNTYTTSESATITFKTTTTPSACDPFLLNQTFTWLAQSPQVTSSVTIHDKATTPCTGSDGKTYTQTTSYDVDNGTATLTNADLAMIFTSATNGGYGLSWGEYVDAVKITVAPSGACGGATYTANNVPWGPLGSASATAIGYFPNPVPLPSTVSTLTCTPTPSFTGASFVTGGNADWAIGCNLTPAFAYDVLVTAVTADYPSWRPMGAADEIAIGNLLGLQARIVYKGTTQTAVGVNPDQWMFTLKDYSSEPGVALNWPPKKQLMNPSPPDLDFNLAVNMALNPGIVIPPPGTTAQIPLTAANAGSLSSVELSIESHDWGAWATLNVTTTVAGQPILGHLTLPNGQNVTDILLPFRQPGSHIANSWKDAHKVPLDRADYDDSETNPTGDGQPGDGLTLYEEYRGFYMECSQPAGCQHVEGDPNTKDLFIVQLIPADAGIELLKAASGLNVHYRGLTLTEVGQQDPSNPGSYRVINFNHAQGAHEVDQHAIVIDWGTEAGISGAANIDTFACGNGAPTCPALPKHIDHIDIDPKFRNLANAGSVQRDFFTQYTSTVAHEIAHSLDIYHHGDIVDHMEFWSIDPTTGVVSSQPLSPQNTLTGGSAKIVVLAEDQDPSSPNAAKFQVSSLNLDKALLGNPLDLNGRPLAGRPVYVGNVVCTDGTFKMNGEHSGDQASFMRYDQAEAYIPEGFPTVRFWTGGHEDPGSELTDHPVGTGVNDPRRIPRPRYGDADVTLRRGNDRSQLDVNDNNKEVFRPIFTCPGS